MRFQIVLLLSTLFAGSLAAAPDNTVAIRSEADYCLVIPRQDHTNVGDSEHPGGMTVGCTNPPDDSVYRLPSNFWSSVTLVDAKGAGRYRQVGLGLGPPLTNAAYWLHPT